MAPIWCKTLRTRNPSNTLWSKQHNLYSKVDTEAPRYLEFERWWGGHVNLNAEEIQFIVDELFIGNNLATGRIQTSDGRTIDLRNIRSPIVVFCSKGDNITPPQQALGWILDLYEDVDEIRSNGQTIVYAIHETAGHLGIFVSSGVARKEHTEFSSNIDLIDVLPPGLYEAVFQAKSPDVINPHLASGEWIMRCETRTLDDIRALGGNDAEDERRFATAARVSENNLAVYRAFAQPFVRAMATPQAAEFVHRINPLRMQYELFSDRNPFMAWIGAAAGKARETRIPTPKDNPLAKMQENVSQHIVKGLDAWRDMAEKLSESAFLAIYGSPQLQAAVGIDPKGGGRQRMGKDPLHQQLVQERIAELKSRITDGGLREAAVRGLLYIGMTRGAVDERAFETIRRIRQSKDMAPLSLDGFKTMVREQFFMLLINSSAAIAGIPSMLANKSRSRTQAFELIKQVTAASGKLPPEGEARLRQIESLFSGADESTLAPTIDMTAKAPPSQPARLNVVQNEGTKK